MTASCFTCAHRMGPSRAPAAPDNQASCPSPGPMSTGLFPCVEPVRCLFLQRFTSCQPGFDNFLTTSTTICSLLDQACYASARPSLQHPPAAWGRGSRAARQWRPRWTCSPSARVAPAPYAAQQPPPAPTPAPLLFAACSAPRTACPGPAFLC
jgi:hypothetical protein